MLRPAMTTALIGIAGVTLSLADGTAAAAAAPAPHAETEEVQQVTLYYDDSEAAEFQGEIAAGAQEWNDNVENVTLERADQGQDAEIRIVATDGWPQATLGPVRPGGQARIEFGRQAVDEGYDTVRIASHELGHSLGLPDDKPGPCSSLMSGSTGGVDCTNPTPNEAEQAQAEANYGNGVAGEEPADDRVLVDAP
ncbi:snapalysin family zinc-dependent metalloprotease [Allosalinactinospora lopnorensis]|uniref:snapalysin family zinc-dependent metalloprotease n=1 Tax=Allosalinactinospora lopnorensis TaxID=1352348 RepID=UPI00069720DC|nr:snapalysin family zinc-dependent metalloprotease [Allosalinactinospora lopnorensis]